MDYSWENGKFFASANNADIKSGDSSCQGRSGCLKKRKKISQSTGEKIYRLQRLVIFSGIRKRTVL